MTGIDALRDKIEIITAGAGSGKTYRITQEIAARINAGMDTGGLLASTFTRKAAAELQERIQATLMRSGRADAALAAQDALIGTVNAVCGRVLVDFAFEAGLSPDLIVLDEVGATEAFRRAVDAVASRHERSLAPILARLGMNDPGDDGWVGVVQTIVAAARVNRLDHTAIRAAAQRSVDGVLATLGPAAKDGPALDRALTQAIRTLLRKAETWNVYDGPANTRNALKVVREFNTQFVPEQGRFPPWAAWVALTKVAPAAARREDFVPVVEASAAHDHHPRLRADLETLITTCFDVAAEALAVYADHKRRQGLIDFIDQETLALDLLERNQEVRAELASRLDTVFVDEFQDTSPLQLALFFRLAELAKHAVWVGDPKQAIYGFRGTDPELMNAAMRALDTGDDAARILGTSRRSRPGLVQLANAIFVPAFASQGLSAARVRLAPHRKDQPGHAVPLQVWRLQGRNIGLRVAALADQTARMLADPNRPMIEDRLSARMRALRGGDLAILCRDNSAAGAIADALATRGLKVATERGGLLGTPEVRLTLAALRRFADGRDRLAAAEIAHLAASDTNGAWLGPMLDGGEPDDPRIAALDGARARLGLLPPVAALGEILSIAGILPIIEAWSDWDQRRANIDALYHQAVAYEEECRTTSRAASIAGFVAWLGEREEAGAQPATHGEDAIAVLTYHRAKGLEWPAVIMTQPGKAYAATAFGVKVESDVAGFDAVSPLAGRWIRYWPWPYGQQSSGIAMRQRAAATDAWKAMEQRAASENTRLGYVGMTRARDLLILALEPGKSEWIDGYAPGLAGQLQAMTAGHGTVNIGDTAVGVVCRDAIASDDSVSAPRPAEVCALAWPLGVAPDFPNRRLNPSQSQGRPAPDPSLPEIEIIDLGGRLARSGSDARSEVGEALHRFFAADDPTLPLADRVAVAGRLNAAWAAGLEPEDFIIAADRLWRFLREKFGSGAALLREWPVRHRWQDGREVHGRVDLLVRHCGGFAILDHKSFPGQDAAGRAAGYLPQLAYYAESVTAPARPRLRELLIHMPIVGKMVVTSRY